MYRSNYSKSKSYQIQKGSYLLFVFLAISLSIGPSYQAFKSILIIPEISVIEYLVIHPNASYAQTTLLEISHFIHTTLR